MKKSVLWLATSNVHKLQEFQQLLENYQIKSLLDFPDTIEIVEDGTTFAQNAMIKAKTLANLISEPAIGDDSGIEVEALDGFPGIYSARWAEPITDSQQINDLLLEKMVNVTNRNAQMTTVIAYFNPITKEEKYFLGVIKGTITMEPMGDNVFGYDQIFKPNGSDLTFSQMGLDKQKYSHRHLAIVQLNEFLTGSEKSESKKN